MNWQPVLKILKSEKSQKSGAFFVKVAGIQSIGYDFVENNVFDSNI